MRLGRLRRGECQRFGVDSNRKAPCPQRRGEGQASGSVCVQGYGGFRVGGLVLHTAVVVVVVPAVVVGVAIGLSFFHAVAVLILLLKLAVSPHSRQASTTRSILMAVNHQVWSRMGVMGAPTV